MTDLEISRALALAIGWEPRRIFVTSDGRCGINRPQRIGSPYSDAVYFDYRDPAIIWPIAERYDCFPIHEGLSFRAFVNVRRARLAWGDTPAKAVALAVIRKQP